MPGVENGQQFASQAAIRIGDSTLMHLVEPFPRLDHIQIGVTLPCTKCAQSIAELRRSVFDPGFENGSKLRQWFAVVQRIEHAIDQGLVRVLGGMVGQHLRQHVGHLRRRQWREGITYPLAIAEPGIAPSFVAQRFEQYALVGDRKCRHIAVENDAQRIEPDQLLAVLHVMHRQPPVQAAQRLDDASVAPLHQCQHATQRQTQLHLPRDGSTRQILGNAAVARRGLARRRDEDFAGERGTRILQGQFLGQHVPSDRRSAGILRACQRGLATQ